MFQEWFKEYEKVKKKKSEFIVGNRTNGQSIHNAYKILKYINDLPEDGLYGIQKGAKGILFLTKEKCITVSKIKKKIEELEKKMKYEDNEKVLVQLYKQRKVLQELMEDK